VSYEPEVEAVKERVKRRGFGDGRPVTGVRYANTDTECQLLSFDYRLKLFVWVLRNEENDGVYCSASDRGRRFQ